MSQDSITIILKRLTDIYIQGPQSPVKHSWCRLCKGNDAYGAPSIDHHPDCVFSIIEQVRDER